MPNLRPFRALRFNMADTDLSAVLSPPYDIISPEQRTALLQQDPHNAVRIELPADIGTGEVSDYNGAADTVAEWRRDGVLIKDNGPTITIHEMSWTEPEGRTVSSTGFLVRLKLEEFGPDAGVLPHERTMAGPKKDRYQLLEATRLNTSPLAFLAGSDGAATSALLAELRRGPADAEATTADGVHHRLWICEGDSEKVAALLELVSAAPITIADGHHRYETALSFRADQDGAGQADPAWDYVMALVYALDDSPPALPTHRVLLGGPTGEALLAQLGGLFRVELLADRAALLARMAAPSEFAPGATGTGRLGVFSGGQAALLTVDQDAIDGLLDDGLSAASRGLDVNALTAAIERIYGADPGVLAGQGQLQYVKDAVEATQLVEDGQAASCYLLDLMPASAIARVAEEGELMPQKSTYFNPKAPTGLAFSPLEW